MPDIQYLPVTQGKPMECPSCGLTVSFRIDKWKCLQQFGGCEHIVVREQAGNQIRVGFCNLEIVPSSL